MIRLNRTEILRTAKPLLFGTEMVRAIQDGRKTVTRRPVKNAPKWADRATMPITLPNMAEFTRSENGRCEFIKPPYQVGDILYVRETWATEKSNACIAMETGNCPHKSCDTADGTCFADEYIYKAENLPRTDVKWHPSIHMPKEAARIFLRVTGVTVQRVKEITEEQAISEGFNSRAEFISEFLKIYPSCTEDSWVWVIEFERVEAV